MIETPPAYWLLSDLAGIGDLADEYGVSKATMVNWTNRYNDFPAVLVPLSCGRVYSRWQVRRWYDSRTWHPLHAGEPT